MIHVKKSKIDQEIAELWGVEVPMHFLCGSFFIYLRTTIFLKS